MLVIIQHYRRHAGGLPVLGATAESFSLLGGDCRLARTHGTCHGDLSELDHGEIPATSIAMEHQPKMLFEMQYKELSI